MRATAEAPDWTSQFRELIGPVDADLDDATGRADLLHPDDYRASHIFGAERYPHPDCRAIERRAAGSNDITWPSIHYPEGQCIAVFWPNVIPIPTQGAHFACHWNGAAVDFVKTPRQRRCMGSAMIQSAGPTPTPFNATKGL